MEREQVAVVLVEPRKAGNVGAAARAMANMGMERLVLVRPVDHLVPEAFHMAVHGREILERARVCDDLGEALGDFGFVVGTTRRRGKARTAGLSPRSAASRLVAERGRNRCAVVFGREESGLTNLEIEQCHVLATIPTSEHFQSLNLAQAVLVMAYEIFLAAGGGGRGAGQKPRKLATRSRLEEMYDHVGRVLLEIGYLDRHNPRHMMRVFRKMLTRAGLDEGEVSAIRGIFRQVEWCCGKGQDQEGEGCCHGDIGD